MEDSDYWILIIGVLLFLKFVVYDYIIAMWANGPSLQEVITHLLNSFWIPTFLIVIAIIIFIYANVFFYKRAVRKELKRIKQEELIRKKKKKIREVLNRNISFMRSEELEKYIKELEELDDDYFEQEIEDKIELTHEELTRTKRDEELNEYYNKKQQLEAKIKDLKKMQYEESLKLKNKKEVILKKLDTENNTVYESKDLKPEEAKVLKEEGFKEINEYDPISERNASFFVKQILNHSHTHTFLVGRIKKLILQYVDHEDVRIHDTRDADLTFEVGAKIYALEIETGNLLKKKKQMREKVHFLNNKYGQNWYFVVSNRDLLTKYKKYGPSIPRARVRKIVEKLANI